MELKRWQVYILEKTNVLRFDLKESREGFRHQHDISCSGLFMMDMSYKYHCFFYVCFSDFMCLSLRCRYLL